MILKAKNYAFIDSQNLNLGIQKQGWKLNYKKFRVYLHEKYGVEKAYMFNECSSLLKQTAKDKIHFMNDLQTKLEYKRKVPLKDGTLNSTFP